jgi:hypothetical protein
VEIEVWNGKASWLKKQSLQEMVSVQEMLSVQEKPSEERKPNIENKLSAENKPAVPKKLSPKKLSRLFLSFDLERLLATHKLATSLKMIALQNEKVYYSQFRCQLFVGKQLENGAS